MSSKKTQHQQRIADIQEAVEDLEVMLRFMPTKKNDEKTELYAQGIEERALHIIEVATKLKGNKA